MFPPNLAAGSACREFFRGRIRFATYPREGGGPEPDMPPVASVTLDPRLRGGTIADAALTDAILIEER